MDAFASLTVIPTLQVFESVDKPFALTARHWFFLAQSVDEPERLVCADPQSFVDASLTKMTGSLDRIDSTALATFRHAFRDPLVRHAVYEDYRAAVEEDREHDTAHRVTGVKLERPIPVFWPERKDGGLKTTPVYVWCIRVVDVSGKATVGVHVQPRKRRRKFWWARFRSSLDRAPRIQLPNACDPRATCAPFFAHVIAE